MRIEWLRVESSALDGMGLSGDYLMVGQPLTNTSVFVRRCVGGYAVCGNCLASPTMVGPVHASEDAAKAYAVALYRLGGIP